MIDVGGDRYYLGQEQTASIDLAYKSRKDFYNTFLKNLPNDAEKKLTEKLLRTYMPYQLTPRKYEFKNPQDKMKLIAILKKRANQLLESPSYSSSVLKNNFFQLTYRRIQEIIQEIEKTGPYSKQISNSNSNNIKYLQNLSEKDRFHLILELSWYLLHPDMVPRDVLKQWKTMIEQQQKERLTDLIQNLQEIQKTNSTFVPLSTPLNYFQRINIGKSAKSNDIYANALEMAKQTKDMDEQKKQLTNRLTTLLSLLQTRQFLDKVDSDQFGPTYNQKTLEDKLDSKFNPLEPKKPKKLDKEAEEPKKLAKEAEEAKSAESAKPASTKTEANPLTGRKVTIKNAKQMAESAQKVTTTIKASNQDPSKSFSELRKDANKPLPSEKATQPEKKPAMKGGKPKQSGGALSIFDKKMVVAMNPLFEYFKSLFDPIYPFLESSLLSFSETSNVNLLPSLLILLHLCLNIRPSPTKEGGLPTYGVYRIEHPPAELLSFIRYLIGKTEEKITQFTTDEEKNTFNEEIFLLPKIRLTTLLNPLAHRKSYKDPEDFPYLQLFTVGNNLHLRSRNSFLNSSNPKLTELAYESVTDFFQENNLYLVCTKPSQAREDIPMNVHTIDFSTVDVGETSFPIDTMPDHYFNKHTNKNEASPPLEKLVELTPYVLCNDGEIALSAFIALKERMPK
jgi:hypothetical protein